MRPGYISFRVKNNTHLFDNEAGGHRFQRIPSTEKRGRVQTSTITIAVMKEEGACKILVSKDDIEEKFTKGSGSGGQKRNKTSSTVMLTHKPTGISVRVDAGRSQTYNRQAALDKLVSELQSRENKKFELEEYQTRKSQVGSGMRGDKRRTIQVKNDNVIDHVTGKRTTWKKYSRGIFDELI